jgi:hypothetical protein
LADDAEALRPQSPFWSRIFIRLRSIRKPPRPKDLAPAASLTSASVNGRDSSMRTIEHAAVTRGSGSRQGASSCWPDKPGEMSLSLRYGTPPRQRVRPVTVPLRARRTGPHAHRNCERRFLTTPRPEGRGFQPSPAGVPVSRPAAPGRSRNVLCQLRRPSPLDQRPGCSSRR